MKANKISILKGPDRIRKRPGVIFLSDGIAGVQFAVEKILEIFVAQARRGNGRNLHVVQTGAGLEIRADDRGLYLGQDTADDSVWKQIFCDLYPAPAYPPRERGKSFSLWEPFRCTDVFDWEEPGILDLCAAQCASKYMDVEVVRDGIKSTLLFRKGHNMEGLRSAPTAESSGTCLRFEMDREVFTETVIPEAFFLEILRKFAMQAPGLCCSYNNSETGQTASFCFQDT